MVSKLLIDVDENRQPVLSIKGFRSAVESDDVRDKLVRGFVESVGSRNGLASIYFDDSGDVLIKPASDNIRDVDSESVDQVLSSVPVGHILDWLQSYFLDKYSLRHDDSDIFHNIAKDVLNVFFYLLGLEDGSINPKKYILNPYTKLYFSVNPGFPPNQRMFNDDGKEYEINIPE